MPELKFFSLRKSILFIVASLMLVLLSPKALAVPDAVCATANAGKCGAAGGCDPGELCTAVGLAQTICKTNTTDCPIPCGENGQSCCNNTCVSSALTCINGICKVAPPPPPPPGGYFAGNEYNGPVIASFSGVFGAAFKVLYSAGLLIGIFFIIKSGYTLMTSQGDPQAVKEGQEQLTASIIGILFIVLSVALLRIIINSLIGESVNI